MRPKIERRRRGKDFFDNFERALSPAKNGQVDLVIHGGDLFFRSRVFPKIVSAAFDLMKQVAETGVPVFLVPGNHERSWIPTSLFDTHPNIFIFEKPKTYFLNIYHHRMALVGFPFVRHSIRDNFKQVLQKTQFNRQTADIKILCLHQAVEGAQVGVQNYTFREGADVIRGRDIPADFDAVFSGHIHRWQVLQHDLSGRVLPAPVFYPGAIERTSFVERNENKGYLIFDINLAAMSGSKLAWKFVPLPTRPMVVIEVSNSLFQKSNFISLLTEKLSRLDQNSVVKIRLDESIVNSASTILNARLLRSIAPETMNIELALVSRFRSH